jgi:hypothetical protein
MFLGSTRSQEDTSCNGSQAKTYGFIYPAVSEPQ